MKPAHNSDSLNRLLKAAGTNSHLPSYAIFVSCNSVACFDISQDGDFWISNEYGSKHILSIIDDLLAGKTTDNPLGHLRAQSANSLAFVVAFYSGPDTRCDDFGQIINESFRILAPGGVLFIEVRHSKDSFKNENLLAPEERTLKVEISESIKSLLVEAGFVAPVLLSKQPSLTLESPDLSQKKIWSNTSGDAEIYARKPLINAGFYQIDTLIEELKERDLNARVTNAANLIEDKFTEIQAKLEKLNNQNFELTQVALRHFRLLADHEDDEPTVHSSVLIKFLVFIYKFKIARKVGKYLLIRFPSFKQAIFDIIMFGDLNSSQSFESLSLKPRTRRPRLIYVDVTGLCLSTLNTGIQRVTREIEKNLRVVVSKNFLVVPVYATKRRFRFKHALEFEIASGNQPSHNLKGGFISPELGDIFIGLDLQVGNVIANTKYFQMLHNQGIKIYFILYDLLPIEFPEFFDDDVKPAHEAWLRSIAKFSGVICISDTVKHHFDQWLGEKGIRVQNNFKLDSIRLGYDFVDNAKSSDLELLPPDWLRLIGQRKMALMVGTLEPRKGYGQIISMFDQLWSQGVDDCLVIVGKRGWKVDRLVKELEQHPIRNKNLFWIEDADDHLLQSLYARAHFLIAASYGEGFGLPLVEANSKGLPIFARDIEIFREALGNHAFYFKANNTVELCNEYEVFQESIVASRFSYSRMKNLTSWANTAEDLFEIISDEARTN